ncbi:MAG TPA: prepilin-type N-terminal cleavage/methylation domain-containing protein [Gemmatimonadaceae bacterium]|jgi:prepilin-type N-terminal cleavage/methylation domain-containing protein
MRYHIASPSEGGHARSRRGFTLIEIMISMTLMLTIIGLSTQLFRKQAQAVASQSGVLDAQQNSRFAVSMLERELRVAGVGVVDQQPLLVMASPTSLSFNANLVSLDTGDLGSVYVNGDIDSASAGVWKKADRAMLPGTTTFYPNSTYVKATGVLSEAETITYWVSADSSSSWPNEYILWRRVNARPARMVARGIYYRPGTDTLFRYFKSDTLGSLTEIPVSTLPIVHTATVHGTQADTGKSAMTDSVRQVRAQLNSINHLSAKASDTTQRRLNLTIKLMNAGLIHHVTCGSAPIAPTSLTATVTPASPPGTPQTFVTVRWNASVDDLTGEKDVERYAIYRRLSSATAFDEPIASVVAGRSTYSFIDTDLLSGQQWVYGVTALDCSPLNSPMVTSSTATIP